MYRMNKISKEAYEKCEIETIDDREYFWINRKDLEIESGYYWAQMFDKCDPEKQTYRHESIPNTKFQPYRVFAQSHLALMKQNDPNISKVIQNMMDIKED